MEQLKNNGNARAKKNGFSILSIFINADCFDRWLMMIGLIGSVVSGTPIPVGCLFTSRIINIIGVGSTLSKDVFSQNINKYVFTYFLVVCGTFTANFLAGYCWTRTAERQATRMRASYLKAVMRQDVAYFDMHESTISEVITTVSGDTSVIQDVISEKVPNFLMSVSMFLACNVVAFIILWRLAVVAIPFTVLLIIIALMCGRKLMEIARKIQEEYNAAGKIAEQTISSVRTVYSFVGENKSIAEFSEALERLVKLGLKQGLVKGMAVGSNSVQFAIWAIICYYGSTLVMYNGAQGGSVLGAASSMGIGGLAIGSAIFNLKSISEACIVGERIKEMMERVPKIDSYNMDGEILENVSGEVEFSHVQFAYPSRPESMIFTDFCLKIQSAKRLALVGGSGSGKSTVIALLQRFYNPLGGEIRLDGVALGRLQLKWLRSKMGLVSQEPSLFATTIKENILFGKEDADMEEIIEAAKASNAHDFISQLPLGYDTQVGERGVQMSGGQKQRIAIARAIIKKPRILLLDEATSALDSVSESIVQEALDKATMGQTTIIIAHRLSTIRNVDTIAVIRDGHVMETGTHNELISHPNGLYTSLVRVQKTKTLHTNQKSEQSSSSGHHIVSNFITSNDMSSNRSQRLTTSTSSRSSFGHSSPVHSFCVEDGVTECKEVPKATNVPSFKRLLAMNRPEWKQASIGCLSATMSGAIMPVYSILMGSILSVFFSTDHAMIKEKTRDYSLSFLGLAVFGFFINLCLHYNLAYMGEKLTMRNRIRMLSKILRFEVGWFDHDENSTGTICSRLATDATTVRSLVGDRVALLMQTLSTLIVSYTIGIVIAWRLALVMISLQPLLILCYYTRQVLLKVMSKKALEHQEESSKLAAEAISNLRTITTFSSQGRILMMLKRAQQDLRRESYRQSWYAGLGLAFSYSIANYSMAFTFWYSGKLFANKLISSKALFETLILFWSTSKVIADAGSMTSDLTKGLDSITSVFKILDRDTQIEPVDDKGLQAQMIKGLIELDDVHFAYPTRPNIMIFQGFSINIKAGKSTALVGQSGSGKSTIIGLIERFYDPIKGVVKIDGQDIRSYHLKSLRKHIALVSQEPTLFAGTIKENITYGASDEISETEIIEAAKAANAHNFIAGLKDGYGTSCGDKGVQLSGGQKQRIAIARAILKNPKILLLDEATSALDSQSEKVVQEALEGMMVGRTSVVVAHRLTTIQNCDKIAVLEKGKVVEKGTHSQLLAKGPKGAYYSLINLQRTTNSTITTPTN